MHDVETVGGKNASLGEMIGSLANLGVRVPGGFATTADAFQQYLDTLTSFPRQQDRIIDPQKRRHLRLFDRTHHRRFYCCWHDCPFLIVVFGHRKLNRGLRRQAVAGERRHPDRHLGRSGAGRDPGQDRAAGEVVTDRLVTTAPAPHGEEARMRRLEP